MLYGSFRVLPVNKIHILGPNQGVKTANFTNFNKMLNVNSPKSLLMVTNHYQTNATDVIEYFRTFCEYFRSINAIF